MRTGGSMSTSVVQTHLLSHKLCCKNKLSPSQSTFERAQSDVLTKLRLEISEEYLKLPHYLRLFQGDNPTSSVALQVDDQGCFYRMFVTGIIALFMG